MEECGGIPLAIVRPTIVTAAMKEPLPGWVDNLNGPTGNLVDTSYLKTGINHLNQLRFDRRSW